MDRSRGRVLSVGEAGQRGRHHRTVRARACRGRRIHPRLGLLADKPVHRCAAAVLRLHPARPDPRRSHPAPAGRRRSGEGQLSTSAGEQSVLDRIDETWITRLTTALVRAAGGNPPGGEAATVAVLSAAAAELGLDVVETSVEPGRSNLRITLEGGSGPACCYWAIPMWFRSAVAGPGIRSAAISSMAESMAVAPRT